MNCDDGLYEVAYTIPVTVRVRAANERRAKGKAFVAMGGSLDQRKHLESGESSSVGWASDITVKEVPTAVVAPDGA
jgi:hypothetical protein